jgi:hypothetical protein
VTILECVDAVCESVDRELFDAKHVSSLLWGGSLFCDKAVNYPPEMILGKERRDMGLNSGIVKHADHAGVPSAAAGFGWINDDSSDRGIPGREAQPEGPGQTNCDPSDRDDQLPSATEKVDEFAKVKSRRLSRGYNFVSVIRLNCHG